MSDYPDGWFICNGQAVPRNEYVRSCFLGKVFEVSSRRVSGHCSTLYSRNYFPTRESADVFEGRNRLQGRSWEVCEIPAIVLTGSESAVLVIDPTSSAPSVRVDGELLWGPYEPFIKQMHSPVEEIQPTFAGFLDSMKPPPQPEIFLPERPPPYVSCELGLVAPAKLPFWGWARRNQPGEKPPKPWPPHLDLEATCEFIKRISLRLHY